jgi:NAD(P)H dehydrogenase (quinone)
MDDREFLKKPGLLLLVAAFLLGWDTGHAAEAQTVTVLVAYHSVSGDTEKMAQGVADGAKAVSGTKVILKRVADVGTDDLLSSDAVIVGSPVYFGNMSGEVKTFFDNWLLKFGVFREFKMRNKVGGAFTTGAAVSNGKELTMLSILEAMLVNQMVVIGGGGAFGASATTGPDSPGIDDKELVAARDLGKRVAEVASIIKSGTK